MSQEKTHRLNHKRALGIFLLCAPFIALILAPIALYVWIIANGYQGDSSVMTAWFAYAIPSVIWFGPGFIICSIAAVVFGGMVLFSTRNKPPRK